MTRKKGSTAWKKHEKDVADLVGGARSSNSGLGGPDVTDSAFCYEVTVEQCLTKKGEAKMAQAVRQCADGKTPVLVYCKARQGCPTERFFIVKERGWLDWHGKDAALSTALEEENRRLRDLLSRSEGLRVNHHAAGERIVGQLCQECAEDAELVREIRESLKDADVLA